MTDFVAYEWRGLPNPVYLPDFIPVEVKIIPSSVKGWTSGQKIDPKNFTSTTFHDTGNMQSNADGEYNWAASGGRAAIGSAGSYNWINDHRKIIITQWFDELVGHAANHRGNTTSYAGEQAGIGIDFEKSLDIAMWMHAGVLQCKGLTAKKAMYQHNFWSGKDCPGQVRKRNLWSFVEDTVDERITMIGLHVAGGNVDIPEVPEPAKPAPALLPFLFGTAKGYKFDPNGPVSRLWRKEGETTARWPRLVDVRIDGKDKWFVFGDGSVIFAEAGKPVRFLEHIKEGV